MKKHEVMEYMQRYLDQDLSEAETKALYEYLQQDPESMLMFERMNNLSNDLANLPKVSPPISIVDSIMPQLDELAVEPSPLTPKPKVSLFSRLGKSVPFKAGASAALAAGVIGLFIWAGELPKSVPVADEQVQILEAGPMEAESYAGEHADGIFDVRFTASVDEAEPTEKADDVPMHSAADEASNVDDSFSADNVANVDDTEADNANVQADRPTANRTDTIDLEAEAKDEGGAGVESGAEAGDLDGATGSLQSMDSDRPLDRQTSQGEATADSDISTDSVSSPASLDESEAFAVIPSPSGQCAAKLFEQDGRYTIVIVNQAGEVGYSTTWNSVDAIDSYHWSEDGTVFKYDLVEGDQRTSIGVHVEEVDLKSTNSH